MKRILLTVPLACLCALSVRADLIWYEPFNYSDGDIGTVSSGVWVNFSGNLDMEVYNHTLEVSSSYGNVVSRTGDYYRSLGSPYGDTAQVLYASFTVSCTNLPDADGAYFASFYSTGSGYYGRIFAQTNGTVLPNTWRLAVSGHGSAASQVYPVDLALNTDYQVVVQWDPISLYALTMWVNPINSSDPSTISSDAVTAPPALNTFAFRQASSFGDAFFILTNLATSTSFDEAATNVWTTNAVAPQVVYQPTGSTNFVGDNVTLSVVANGQGLASLTYQWRKNGADFSNPAGNANTLNFSFAQATDSGSYQVVVTTPYSLSVTSDVAFLWVTNPPVPPTITQQPTNTAVYYGQTAVLYCGATGPDFLTYTWYHNGNSVSSEGNPNVTGDGTEILTIANVQTTNDTTGTYRCDVSNIYGTTVGSNAVVSALPPVVTNIGYLRGLIDANLLPTNTTTYFQATGIVISKTNYTSTSSSSFYMQDDTGGIDVFVGGGIGGVGGSAPAFGDSVTVTGPLGQYQSLLEFNLSASNPGHSVVINSSGNLVPPGKVLPLTFTNSVEYGGISNAFRLYQGSLITFTNVYFKAADGVATFTSGNTTLTNENGDTFTMYVYSAFSDIIGQVIPQGKIWRITGPMSFYLSPTAPDRSAGYEIEPSMFEDIVTTPPAAVNVTVNVNGSSQPVLAWTAEPFTSYTVLRSSVLSPNLADYQAVASGLTFNTTAGTYTDTSAPAPAFYKVVSP